MKRLITLAATALLLSLQGSCALAGGFPSRPQFQSVGVGQQAPVISGQVAVSGSVSVGGTITAPALTAGAGQGLQLGSGGYVIGVGAASIAGGLSTAASGLAIGVDSGFGAATYIDATAPADQKLQECYENAGAFNCQFLNDSWTTSAAWLVVARSGVTPTSVNFPAGTLEAKSEPAISYGATVSVAAGSSCSIAAQGAGGLFTGCTRLQQGKYQLNYSNLGIPTCVAGVINTAGYIAQIQIPTSTHVEVDFVNASTGTFFEPNGTTMSILCSYQ